MCGINGIFGLKDRFRTTDMLVHMNNALVHRGPDATGIFTDENIGLGHRRLSIIDLSEEARQPMTSASGRYTIVYNGEIYNYKSLKATHRKYPYRTETDTEVILALLEEHGTQAFPMLDGMFAMAIWDREKKQLLLVRDRMGVKPLYFCRGGDMLLFSSEIKGLLASGHFKARINRRALGNYLMYQTVYSPETIVNGVQMLPAGSYAVVDDKGFGVRHYWRMEDCRDKYTLPGPYEKVIKQTRELIFKAVEKRLMSDVPLGAFLSGGIDSSAIVAVMSKLSERQVKTFNVYFDEQDFSEKRFAEMIADKYRTDHHPVLLRPDEFLHDIPEALDAMDHPGMDGLNTYIISKYTKKAGITVALSGIGGDELFGGYPVFGYLQQLKKYRFIGKLPIGMRKSAAILPSRMLKGKAAQKLAMLAGMPSWDWAHMYPVFRQSMNMQELEQAGVDYHRYFQTETDDPFGPKLVSEITIAECSTYLENVLLRDADQMGMAHSLEIREPFLDKDLVEFMLAMPDDFKPLKPPKQLLIDAMGDLIPREIWDRPKMGFSFPWQAWMNRELKPFCTERLELLKNFELLNPAYIDGLISGLNQKDNPNWHKAWSLAVLGHWINRQNIHD
jgi:asparagine synthase (glutamine-hydrolysing)